MFLMLDALARQYSAPPPNCNAYRCCNVLPGVDACKLVTKISARPIAAFGPNVLR
jgi:hypothetical protein